MLGYPPGMSDSEYLDVVNADITRIGQLFDGFDAGNAAAVMCLRDRTGSMNTLYCGGPVYAMICFSSLINCYLMKNNINLDNFMTLDELTENIAPMAYEQNLPEYPIDGHVQLSDPRSGTETRFVPESSLSAFASIKEILWQYVAPDEVWLLAACVNGATMYLSNGDGLQVLKPLRFAIGHFLANVPCPFCGTSMDFKHFMSHVSDIQNHTTDVI